METRELQIRKIEENRTIEFIISDDSIDAHGTILSPDGWNLARFEKNGVFSYQHNLHSEINPDYVLGPATAYKEGSQLIGRATFETENINPLAEKIYKKVKNGTLKAVSVGFIPKSQHLDGDVVVFDEMELLEFSIVNIPSNPNAVKRNYTKSRKLKNYILNYL
jgi:HK97 family phage prohead protease